MKDSFSLESIRNDLFDKNIPVETENEDLTLEGYEGITEDLCDDPTYFASQEATCYGEAQGASVLVDLKISQIAQEAEAEAVEVTDEEISEEAVKEKAAAAGKAAKDRIVKIAQAIAEIFKKLAATVVNFAKKVQVYVKTIMLKEQKMFYEKTVKPNEAKIKGADVAVKVALPKTPVSKVVADLKKDVEARKTVVASAMTKAEGIADAADAKAVIAEVQQMLKPEGKVKTAAAVINGAFYGAEEAPAVAEVKLADLLKVMPLEFLGAEGVKAVTEFQKTGFGAAKEMDGNAKKIMAIGKKAEKKAEEGTLDVAGLSSTLQAIRAESQVSVTVVINSFNMVTRLMSALRGACNAALKAEKKADKGAEGQESEDGKGGEEEGGEEE